jgi:hypothetical protein
MEIIKAFNLQWDFKFNLAEDDMKKKARYTHISLIYS